MQSSRSTDRYRQSDRETDIETDEKESDQKNRKNYSFKFLVDGVDTSILHHIGAASRNSVRIETILFNAASQRFTNHQSNRRQFD